MLVVKLLALHIEHDVQKPESQFWGETGKIWKRLTVASSPQEE